MAKMRTAAMKGPYGMIAPSAKGIDHQLRAYADTNHITTIRDIYTARMNRGATLALSESNREIAKLQIEASKEIAAATEKQTASLTRATWVVFNNRVTRGNMIKMRLEI
jgi:hypothetical protein